MKSLAMVLLFAAACGSKTPTTTTPGGGGEGTAEVALPDVPFDELNAQQRAEFMKQKVVPTMKPIFQNHDAKAFADFGCKTCHGEGVKDHKFDMPNDKLPKLNFKDMSKFKKEDVEWMKTEVLPTMAKLLKQEVYSEQNPKGFGCLECHTQEAQ